MFDHLCSSIKIRSESSVYCSSAPQTFVVLCLGYLSTWGLQRASYLWMTQECKNFSCLMRLLLAGSATSSFGFSECSNRRSCCQPISSVNLDLDQKLFSTLQSFFLAPSISMQKFVRWECPRGLLLGSYPDLFLLSLKNGLHSVEYLNSSWSSRSAGVWASNCSSFSCAEGWRHVLVVVQKSPSFTKISC